MHLKGNFETSFFASIMQLLCNEKKTGVLRMISKKGEVEIFYHEGDIINAVGSKKEGRLGYLLRSEGIISGRQLQDCLVEARESKQRIGEVLVGKGYIEPDKLKEIVGKQAKGIIYDLFLWETGEFEYEDADLNLDGVIAAPLNVMTIIMEASQRIDEMSVLTKQITSDRLIFKISKNVSGEKEVKLAANEWSILALIDGTRTVRQLLKVSGYDKFSVYKVLNSLVAYGLIEKRKDVQPADRKASGDYTAIISLYHDVICVMLKNIKIELEKWTYTVIDKSGPHTVDHSKHRINLYRTGFKKWIFAIIDGARSVLLLRQKELLKNYNPDSPVAENIEAVSESIKLYKDYEQGLAFLINTFDEFIINIFNTVISMLSGSSMRKMLQEIEQIFPDAEQDPMVLYEENSMIDNLENILIKEAQQVKKREERGYRTGEIFAIFGNKG